MAKAPKETKAASAPANSAAEAPKTEAKAPKAPKNDLFVRVMNGGKGVEPTKKLPPQAQVIVNAIEAAGDSGIRREELVKNLTGVLQTRQPVGRIVSYYQKLIVEVGAVTVSA
jgi:hypothetical protein